MKGVDRDFVRFVNPPTLLLGSLQSLTESDEWMRQMIEIWRTPRGPLNLPLDERTRWRFESAATIGALPKRGMRMLVSSEGRWRLDARLPKKTTGALTKAWTKNGWTLYSIGASDAGDFDFIAVASALEGKAYGHAVIIECSLTEGASVEPSPIAAEWMRLLGQAVIPFDRNERRKQLAHAFDALAPYVRAYEQAARED